MSKKKKVWTSEIMRPSNGRVVHFTGTVPTDPSDIPAMIVKVNEDGTVNLRVFYNRSNLGSNEWEQEVPYGELSDKPPLRTWHWPPQIGLLGERK